jgi:hypothetical protein
MRRGNVGAGRSWFGVEEGGVKGVRHGVDCQQGLWLCRESLYSLFIHVLELSGDDGGDVAWC